MAAEKKEFIDLEKVAVADAVNLALPDDELYHLRNAYVYAVTDEKRPAPTEDKRSMKWLWWRLSPDVRSAFRQAFREGATVEENECTLEELESLERDFDEDFPFAGPVRVNEEQTA